MVKYYDISEWEEHLYYGTGGTRDKVVVENSDDGCLYYFKTSLKKRVLDYVYEFWSEIIASEIGKSIGVDILHYDVAWNKGRLGCLSKSMLAPQEELQEGYRWLTGFYPEYDANDKDAYSFQIIERLLKSRFQNKGFVRNIIETIVFDSIIGNEDRHQENWGIIVSNRLSDHVFGRNRSAVETEYVFAPIYDSGSSMGRELSDSKVTQMLKDNVQLEAYVNRGRSEIRWEGEIGKQKHLDLIKKVSEFGYGDMVSDIISIIRSKYRKETVSDIIRHVDDCLPEEHASHKIPDVRKDFLIKLVSLRFSKLFELQL